jgi:hypothetical protein
MSRTDGQTKQVLEIAADGFHGWVWVGCPHDWHFALKNICNQLVNICWLFKVSRRDPTLHIPLWVQSVGAKSLEWSSLQHFELIKAYAKLIFFLLKPSVERFVWRDIVLPRGSGYRSPIVAVFHLKLLGFDETYHPLHHPHSLQHHKFTTPKHLYEISITL